MQAPIPRVVLPSVGETSTLVSPRDSISPNKQWKKLADALSRSGTLTNLTGVLSRPGVNQVLTQPLNLHQWKIYQFPDFIRESTPASSIWDYTKSWCSFRVRTGFCTNNKDLTPGTEFLGGLGSIPYGTGGLCYTPTGVDRLFPDQDTVISEADLYPTSNPTEEGEFQDFSTPDFVLEPISTEGGNEYAVAVVWVELKSVSYEWSQSRPNIPVEEQSQVTNSYRYEVVVSQNPLESGWTNFPAYNPYIQPIALVGFFKYPSREQPVVQSIIQLKNSTIDFEPPMQLYPVGTVSDSEYGFTLGSSIPPNSTMFPNGWPKNALIRVGTGSNWVLYRSNYWFNQQTDPNALDNLWWTRLGKYTT